MGGGQPPSILTVCYNKNHYMTYALSLDSWPTGVTQSRQLPPPLERRVVLIITIWSGSALLLHKYIVPSAVVDSSTTILCRLRHCSIALGLPLLHAATLTLSPAYFSLVSSSLAISIRSTLFTNDHRFLVPHIFPRVVGRQRINPGLSAEYASHIFRDRQST